MTISGTTNRNQYTGNGATTVFARTFFVSDADHLKVYTTTSGVTTEVTSGITKDGIGTASGNVTFSVAPASGVTVTLIREVPVTQETDYVAQGSVSTEQVEDDLDLLVQMLQDRIEEIGRAVKVPLESTLSGLELPTPSALSPIGWNAAGTGLVNISLTSVPFTASTDNAVMRYEATSGGMQDSAVTIDDNGKLTINGAGITDLEIVSAVPTVLLEDTTSGSKALIGSDNNGSLYLTADQNSDAPGNPFLYFTVAGTSAMSIDANGHMRVGDATAPTVTAEFAGTDAILLPVGTTAQAPAATAGRIRYNSTLGAPTIANGSVHKVLSSGWELFETAYDFSVDGAVASVLANGWEDGWDYAVIVENMTFDGTTYPEVAFEFAGTTLTSYVSVDLTASGTATKFHFYSELPMARLARNVFGVRFISNRDTDGTYTDTIASGVSSGAYVGISRATAQAMSGFAIRGNSLDNINGGTVKVYRKRNAL